MKLFGYPFLTVIAIAMIVVGSIALYDSRGITKGTTLAVVMDGSWGSVTAVGIVLLLLSVYKLV
jgi:hypothetical protein